MFNDLVLNGQMAWVRAMIASTIGKRKLCWKKSYIDNTLPDFIFDGVRLSISGSAISYVGKNTTIRLKIH